MTMVKICGLTNYADALVAAEAGANLLGFIIWPKSKRAISAENVRPIVEQLRERKNCPTLVGVFVDDSAETVAQTLDYCGLDLAQLHGGEPPSFIGDESSPLFGRSYKAIRPQSYLEAEADAEWFLPENGKPTAPQLMIDAYHPVLVGGTGEISDWDIAQRLTTQVPRLLLAGGLTPANVAQAIRETNAWGVDVASGVEAAPGKKEHALLRAFVANAKSAEISAS